ncbi:thiamine transporter 1-like [Dunckerocampus dactyliophorus]|uniref:thiamine transporter 1-like n=1 Tax=Dunckerocampus dactyliophorus TaxID=161453 RepID=UPI0024060575|nr:thiamine transporter 1-like [Dunckerocampus dactyliophorus]
MATVRRWRSDWRFPTGLLCAYRFFSTVKPLDPFSVPYLTGPDKNLTTEQVSNDIFPVSSYSHLCVLVPVFLLTDWLRYKPVVVLQCAALFIVTAMLRWTESVGAMQASQFFSGVAAACDVASSAYIYSVIDLKWYRKATSYCKSASHLGNTVGSALGQLLVSFHLITYNNILVLTLVFVTIALLASLLLPTPRRSVFFHHRRAANRRSRDAPITRETRHANRIKIYTIGSETEREPQCDARNEEEENVSTAEDHSESGGQVLLQLWRVLLDCYSSRQLLYWSVWWALALCGFNHIGSYTQVLWENVASSQDTRVYNGGVEAVSHLLGAAVAYGVAFAEINWEQRGQLVLSVCSGLGGATLFLMTFINNIWICYASYIVLCCMQTLSMTVATYQIAADLTMERYALVFGANTFAALTLQTIMTAIVVDSEGLALDVVLQFTIYSSYFTAIAVVFALHALWWRTRSGNKELKPLDKNETELNPEPSLT